MNIFINESEGRLRAGWRLLMQLLLAIVFVISLWYPISWLGFDVDATGVLTNSASMVLSIMIVSRFIDLRSFTEFGLQTTNGWKSELWGGTALGVVAMSSIWIIQWMLGYITFEGFGWERPSNQHWILPIFFNMLLMMVVGFYEEYWTRGYQMKVLAEGLHVGIITPRIAVGISMTVTSIFFGVLHAGNPNASIISIINISFAGFMLALPYVLTGRLWVSIGLHFSWNFFQGAIFGFPVSGKKFRTSVVQTVENGPEWFTGGEFGPEAGAIGLVVMATITLWIYIKYKQRLHPMKTDPSHNHVNEMVIPPYTV